jgi:peptidoglycan/LPS O-acetylase OafA/YrhL
VVFYCVLPVLVVGAARAARAARDRDQRVRGLLLQSLLLLLLGLSGKAVAAHVRPGTPTGGYGVNWHSVVERSFWAQADLFSSVVAVLHTEVQDGRLAPPEHWRRIAVALALLVFIPCAWTMHQGEQSYLLQNTGEALGIALLFATVIIPPPNGKPPLRVASVLESRALVAIGLVSYSLFLWHLPIIDWLRAHGLTLGSWGGVAVNLAGVSARRRRPVDAHLPVR